MSGTLYIVATPIGNLEDMTLRALRLLKEVDGVIAEDTRRTRQLLTHFNIHQNCDSYFEYSKKSKAPAILSRLKNGENLALVSDAGTPVLSDPGARLVNLAHEAGIPVVPVPGPSALLAALSVCGYPTEPLHFWGFLSPSRSKRKKVYRNIMDIKGIHVLYESPHKIVFHFNEWEAYFADYYFFVGREMTKKFEEFFRGSYGPVFEDLKKSEARGEYTVVLSREIFKDGESF